MAEKPKKKSTKPKRDAPGVMGSLSAQRPARIAAGRSASARTAPAPKTTATTEAMTAIVAAKPVTEVVERLANDRFGAMFAMSTACAAPGRGSVYDWLAAH